jgi:hypothetical protein
VKVKGTPLEDLLEGWLPADATIAIMKVDVEGSEVAVWKTALPLLKAQRIKHIMAEVVPGRVDPITPWPEVQETITAMYEAGYTCGMVEGGGMTLSAMLAHFERTPGRPVSGPDWSCSLKA